MYVYISLCFQAKKDIFNAVKENLFDTCINSILLKRKAPVKKQVYCVILLYTLNEKFEICNVGSPIGMVVPIFIINIFFNWDSTYRKDSSWLHFNDKSRVQERQQVKDQQSCISVFVAYPTIPSSNQEHQPMHGRMVDLQRYRATSEERNFNVAQPAVYDKINGSFIDQYLILSTFFEVIFHKVWFLSNM